ncbi:MAG TPA: hypothetical protein VIJ09_10915 [Acidimicrobiales bacterium]
MTASHPEPPDRDPRLRRRGVFSTIVWWIDPEENPSGLVYGTVAVGAVLAAESTRRDTFPDTIGATVLILCLYWMAHTYAAVTGDRLKSRESLSAPGLWRSFLHEATIVKGAALPIAVLLVLWATPVTLNTAVTAALWTSAVLLVLIESVAAFRSHLSRTETAVQVFMGSLLGAGVLLVRVLLH